MRSIDLLKNIKEASRSAVLIELQSHYLLGDTDEFDDFEPVDSLLSTGSVIDRFKYACCKFVGFKTVEDEDVARDVWQQLSKEGDANSLLEYSAELFLQKNIKEAFTNLLMSSRKGNVTAIFRVALCYLYGIFVKEDSAKGLQLMKLLTQKKYPDAVYFLSALYGIGIEGLPFDEEKSDALLQEAVKLESKFANTEYGFKLFITSNDYQVKQKGFNLIKSSADIGEPRAMLMLSTIYAKGEPGVVIQDEEQSKLYLSLACDLGYTPALQLLEELKDKIDIDD